MSERLIVLIDAPANSPQGLRVEDAFEQLLDLFDLAKASSEPAQQDFEWRLVSVSMNSPLSVVAEAVSIRPGVNVDAAARDQKRHFAENLKTLKRGQVPVAWSHSVRRGTARDLSERMKTRVGRTEIILPDQDGKKKTQEKIELELPPSLDLELTIQIVEPTQLPPPVKPKEQIGSIEGHFVDVTTYHGKPALQLRERRSGRVVWCMINEENQQKIADEADFNDVWSGRRISVSGRLQYDATGKLSKVYATNIRVIPGSEVDPALIKDEDFTGGMTAAEYLEKFREGNLG